MSKVEHLLFDFRIQVFRKKLYRFNNGLNIKDVKDSTDYDLAIQILKIFESYPENIMKFTKIRKVLNK